MSLDDEGTIEDEDLVDQSARMIAVMDDDRVDPEMEVFDFKVEFGLRRSPSHLYARSSFPRMTPTDPATIRSARGDGKTTWSLK